MMESNKFEDETSNRLLENLHNLPFQEVAGLRGILSALISTQNSRLHSEWQSCQTAFRNPQREKRTTDCDPDMGC